MALQMYIEQQQALHPGDKWLYEPGDGKGQPMLLVHQIKWQQEMMMKYGQHVVGMVSGRRHNTAE